MTVCCGFSFAARASLPIVLPVTVIAFFREQPRLEEPLRDDAHPAGLVHLRRRVAAPGLQVREHGSPPRNAVEVAEGELDASRSRHGDQVEDGVGEPPRGHRSGYGVLERFLRDDGAA